MGVLAAGPVGGRGSLGLYSVACVRTNLCWALGSYAPRSAHGAQVAQALQWNGHTWSVVRLPGASGPSYAYWDISCANGSCWTAVIPDQRVGRSGVYLLHYTAGHWHRAPDVGGVPSDFGYVSCRSADSCWTVPVLQGSVAQQWDGSTWTATDLPTQLTSPAATQMFAQSVTCAAADDCWAVGDVSTGGTLPGGSSTAGTHLTAWHWDGTQWFAGFVRARDTPFGGELTSVACATATSCYAAGYYLDQNGLTHSVLAHWNGQTWSS